MAKKKHTDIVKKEIKKPTKNKIEHLMPKEKINWIASEFHFYPKNRYWIFGIGVLLLGLAFLFIAAAQYFHYNLVLSDYFLIIGLTGMIIVFGQYGHAEPRKFAVELGQSGIVIMGKSYNYDQLRSFWIIPNASPVVYFQMNSIGLPLSILLEDQSIDEVRDYLLRYLPEHPTAMEHIADRLSHFLRF